MVTIYTTQTCPYCAAAKRFFQNHGIGFEEIDVGSDPAKAQEMVQKSGQMGVPVIDVDGEIIVGFQKGKLEEKLGIQA
jgi:glutaredoxin-like YruB-family protein